MENFMSKQILILAGDGIGPEIVGAAEKVLNKVNEKFNLSLTWEHGLLGGAAIDAHGEPYPAVTSEQAKKADAILLGAVGGPKWDTIERSIRPERGLLKIRSELNLFANLRPAILYPQLADASTLVNHVVFVNSKMVKNRAITLTFILRAKLSVLQKLLLNLQDYVAVKCVL